MSEEKNKTNPQGEAAKPQDIKAEKAQDNEKAVKPGENKTDNAAVPDEKKPESIPAASEPKPEQAGQPKTETAAPASEQQSAPKAEAPKKAPEPVKKEKPSTCAGCSKSIKKKRWYYRDGKFYCSKRCWHTKIEKDKPKEAPESSAPAAPAS